jgi:uridine kinase
MEQTLQQIENAVPRLHAGERWILGIDGLSRSGKTTIAHKLCRVLQERGVPVRLLHLDDHIARRSRRYDTGHEPWFEYYQLQWDVEWLGRQLFQKLKAADWLWLPFYNKDDDAHDMRTVEFPGSCVIVVEGVFLQRREWSGYFDHIVYLDCPRNVRLSRESEQARSNMEKFATRYWPAEEYYGKTIVPEETADLVIRHDADKGAACRG